MKYWVKYRRSSSASAGHWGWRMLWSLTEAEANEEAESIANELNDSFWWSEHHRGVEWHVVTEAPKHIIATAIEDTASRLTAMQEKLKRLHLENETAKECVCHSDGSCYCDICGKLIKK